jgi:peptidoglycan/LPS O-acetylase OafA/YrhL
MPPLVKVLLVLVFGSAAAAPQLRQPQGQQQSFGDMLRSACQGYGTPAGAYTNITKKLFPASAELSAGCRGSVTQIEQMATQHGYTFPISAMVCANGLSPGDVGDFYMCSQATYGSGPGTPVATEGVQRMRWRHEDAHFSYWRVVLASIGEGGGWHHHHGGGGVEQTTIGVCLPSACGGADAGAFGRTLVGPGGLRENVTMAGHHHNGTQYWMLAPEGPGAGGALALGFGGWLWLGITVLFALLASVATLPYPYGLHGMPKAPDAAIVVQQVDGALISSKPAKGPSPLARVVANWDMNRNYLSLVKPDPGHHGLRTLNGVRVIAILLVVLGHTYAFMPTDNRPYDEDVVKKRFFSMWWLGDDKVSIGVGFLSVDSFFFLSGFLFMWPQLKAYSLNAETKLTSASFTLKVYTMRWLRLTPMYFYVLMIYIYVSPAWGNGPTWHSGMSTMKEEPKFCKELWFTNVLYISNLFPGQLHERDDMMASPNGEGELGCYVQTWYLSNDFQLCLLTPLVAILWKRSKKAAYGFLAFVLATMHAVVLYETAYFSLSVCDMRSDNPPYGSGDGSPRHSGDFQIMLYDKPWYRPGYFIGVLLACLYVDLQKADGSLPRLPGTPAVVLAWAAVLAVMFCTSAAAFFITHEEYGPVTQDGGGPQAVCNWSRAGDLFFSVFFRTAWCSAVAAMVWLGLTGREQPYRVGQGGPITAFLGASFWTPVSRLTFGVYLTHVMVFRLVYNSMQKPFDYTDYLGAYLLTANYTLALVASLALYMLVEKPFANLVMMLTMPPRRPMQDAPKQPGGVGLSPGTTSIN